MDAHNRPSIRSAWCGNSLLVLDVAGRAGEHPLTGFFFRQTRFLSTLQFTLNGDSPYLCSLAEPAPAILELTYIYPPVEKGGGGGSGSGGAGLKHGILHRDIDLQVKYVVHPASFEMLVRLTNRWQDEVQVDLQWPLAADYATMDEAHFGYRQQSADVRRLPSRESLKFEYTHQQLGLMTEIRCYGADCEYTPEGVVSRLTLLRQKPIELRLYVRAVDADDTIDESSEQLRENRLKEWQTGVAQLHTASETPLIELCNNSLRDLGCMALLEGPQAEWLVPGAGLPLYQSVWGRDALTTAWQAGLFDRGDMLNDVLSMMLRLQGTRMDSERDEEPGRILNQAKRDALTRVAQPVALRSYADFASPFMYIIGIGFHYTLTGSIDTVKQHLPAALRVLDWAHRYGDRDGDGYLEYLTQSKQGPTHQGWKDSENAVVGADGEQIAPPIAPSEIQGYYYAALQYMAVLHAVMGDVRAGLRLWRDAAALKERFNRDFWMEDEGFVALGLDSDKRPIRALTSNAGHCIATGIISDEHLPRLVRRLFEPDLFSGWGIRTLSTKNPAYNPLEYHLGSVWPVENATLLFGLRRYGFNDQALQLATGLYDLARLWSHGRIPECVGGYAREEMAHPGAYPRANSVQAWNQSVLPLLTQALLGLVPVAPMHLLLVDPLLPSWLPEVTLRDLRVADARVTLRFQQSADGGSEFEVVERDGDIRIVRQPWLETFGIRTWDRVHALVQGFLATR